MRNGVANVFCCFESIDKSNNARRKRIDATNTVVVVVKATKGGKMGNSHTNKGESPPSVELPRTHNVRASMRTKLPMPDRNELERRFTKVLVSSFMYNSTVSYS